MRARTLLALALLLTVPPACGDDAPGGDPTAPDGLGADASAPPDIPVDAPAPDLDAEPPPDAPAPDLDAPAPGPDTEPFDTASGEAGLPDVPIPDAAVPEGSSESASPGEVDGADVPAAPCPPEMALVDGALCIDRWEAALEEQAADGSWSPGAPYLVVAGRTVRAVSVEGRVPQGYLSGVEAQAACAASGKRLCTSDEWLSACRGPQLSTYPYGDVHLPGACNDDYPGHPVVDFFGTSEGVWDAAHLNDPGIDQMPGTVSPAGAHPQCVSAWGVFDLHGNLHEWVADAEGTFRGGFYADAAINGPGCLYLTTAHDGAYHDYSTGFRCCLTP